MTGCNSGGCHVSLAQELILVAVGVGGRSIWSTSYLMNVVNYLVLGIALSSERPRCYSNFGCSFARRAPAHPVGRNEMSVEHRKDLDFSLCDLSVVILSHNRLEELKSNLPALVDIARRKGLELIVVDNASTDGSGELIRALCVGPNVKLILNEINLGVAGGRNAGWLVAEREFILNIDDDTRISEDAIWSMVRYLKINKRVGIISPRIVHFRTGASQFDLGEEVVSPSNHHGACNMMRSLVVRAVGPNDLLCNFGGEEFNYSILCRQFNHEVLYLPYVTVGHNNHPRTGAIGAERRIRRAYNLPRLYAKHFPFGLAVRLSMRYSVSHIISAMRAYGIVLSAKVFISSLRGFLDGRRDHQPVSAHVAEFYKNRSLRPEFGNVPLYVKLLRRASADA